MASFLLIYILPALTLGASLVKKLPAKQETRVQSLGKEDPLEKGMATHSSILAGSIIGSGAGVSHCSGFSCGARALGYSGFGSCSTRAPKLQLQGSWSTGSVVVAHCLSCSVASVWDFPGSGIEPVSPALAGRFFTPRPPGKPFLCLAFDSVSIEEVPT